MNLTAIFKKTHTKSFFKQFHCDSPYAKKVLTDETNLIVLQIAKVDTETYLAELVHRNIIDAE